MKRVCGLAIATLLIFARPVFASDQPSPAPESSKSLLVCSDFKSIATRKKDPLCTVPAADKKESEREFKEGLKYRDEGDYRSALDHFKAAAALAPNELPFATAVEVTRQQYVRQALDLGNDAMLRGSKTEALAAFRVALDADPSNEFARQRLNDAVGTLPAVDPSKAQGNFAGAVELAPDRGAHSIHFRGNARELLEQLARTYRLTAFVDETVVNRPVRADIEDASWEQALRAVNKLTKTVWTPLAPNQILFAADDEQSRRMLLRTSMRTFYVAQAASPQELNDLSNTLRVLFDIRYIIVNPAQNTITVRAPQQVVDAASAFMRQLETVKPQVMLDIEVFQVSSTITRQLGVNIPNSFTVFNVPTEAQKLLGGQSIQDILNQLAAGTLDLSKSGAIAALLGQAAQSSPLTQPFAVFGGGITLTGVVIPAVAAQLNQNSSLLVSLQKMTLRAGQGSPAIMKIGTRYPIVTSQYSSVYSIPQLASLAGNTSQGGLATAPTFNYEDIGLNVKAVPMVRRSGDVQLDLEMQVRGLGAQTSLGLPIITNREYKGVISAKDGTQIVVAGQLSQSEALGMSGIPLLSAIPGVRSALSQQSKSTDQSELLIVITPHILASPQAANANPIPVPDFIPR